MTYSEKLKDARWLKKRAEVYAAHNYTCQECGSTSQNLNAHHLWYEFGRDPWDYPMEVFACLCEECHIIRHKMELLMIQDLRSKLTSQQIQDFTLAFHVLIPALGAEKVIDALSFAWRHPEWVEKAGQIYRDYMKFSYRGKQIAEEAKAVEQQSGGLPVEESKRLFQGLREVVDGQSKD